MNISEIQSILGTIDLKSSRDMLVSKKYNVFIMIDISKSMALYKELLKDAIFHLYNSLREYKQEIELTLMSNEKVKKILSEIDVLIDGNYEEKLDDDLPYRGSSNQVIYQFTDRYRDFFKSKKKRISSIEKKEGQQLLTGIPSTQTKNLWKKIKEQNGYS